MSLIVGRSFTEVTVSRNVSTAAPLSASVTVTVIVAVPNWFASGVTVTVRFAPLPPNTMFALGTSAGVRRTARHHQVCRRRLHVAHREGQGARARVFGDRLVGDIADRRQVVLRRHRQQERVHRRAAVRVRHRDRDRGRPELVRRRRHRHRPVRSASAKHDVRVGHQAGVRRTARHHQGFRGRLHVAHRERQRARGRRLRRSSDPRCR